jgi:probable phosphoglycerate mutase
MTTTIYLIRHGETEWNRNGRWQGHADVPLSAEGYRQAHSLAQRLAADGAHFDHIYASDLSRAMETAQIAAQALGMVVQADPALREINVGSWSGLTRNEIIAKYPGAFSTVHSAPDGEQREVFEERVGGALTAFAKRHDGEQIAIFTHGGTIRAMLYHLLVQQGVALEIPHIGNTSITTLRWQQNGWQALRLNDMEHLETGDFQGQAPDVLATGNEASSIE